MGRWDIVCMLQLHEVQRLQVGADAHFRDEYFIFPFDFFETSIVVVGVQRLRRGVAKFAPLGIESKIHEGGSRVWTLGDVFRGISSS